MGLTSWATSMTATPSRADLGDEAGHGGLVGQVEAVQRLVQQQQLGLGDQRLGDEQPLLLTTGHLADRARRIGRWPPPVR